MKKLGFLLAGLLDYFFFFVLGLVGGIIFVVLLLRRTKISIPNTKPHKRILCLNPSRWDWIEEKGSQSHVLLFNYGDYWNHFYLVHLSTPKAQHFSVTNNISVWEFGRGKILPKLGFRFSGFLLDEFRFIREMVHFIKKNKVDVIKSQEPYFNGIRGVILRQLTGCPLVEDIRANYDLVFRATGMTATEIVRWRWVEKVIERITFWRADMVFGGNQNEKEFAIYNGAKPEKTFTVRPMGVGDDHFELLDNRRNLKEELGLADKTIILLVGRLSPEKYPYDVIMSFTKIVETKRDCVLLLVGGGAQEEELKTLVVDLKLEDKVRFLGFQPQEKVRNLMFTADVIVSPLCGSALIEACLSTTPVVAYDFEWQSEIIKDGETGLLVRYRDCEDMAQAVMKVLNNPELAKRLGRNARTFALRQHSPDVIARIESGCFDKLFAGRLY